MSLLLLCVLCWYFVVIGVNGVIIDVVSVIVILVVVLASVVDGFCYY